MQALDFGVVYLNYIYTYVLYELFAFNKIIKSESNYNSFLVDNTEITIIFSIQRKIFKVI